MFSWLCEWKAGAGCETLSQPPRRTEREERKINKEKSKRGGGMVHVWKPAEKSGACCKMNLFEVYSVNGFPQAFLILCVTRMTFSQMMPNMTLKGSTAALHFLCSHYVTIVYMYCSILEFIISGTGTIANMFHLAELQ